MCGSDIRRACAVEFALREGRGPGARVGRGPAAAPPILEQEPRRGISRRGTRARPPLPVRVARWGILTARPCRRPRRPRAAGVLGRITLLLLGGRTIRCLA